MKKKTLYYQFFILMFFTSFLQAQIIVTDADFQENITYTWTNDNEYQLDGLVYIKAGSNLNIEAGTIIKGIESPSTGDVTSALIISKNATINAAGEQGCPIIFTSEFDDLTNPNDLGIDDRGLWGGLIILGEAQLAVTLGTDFLEGLLNSDLTNYGGTNDEDNSGILRYISVRHAGADIAPGNPFPAITLGGVGSNTIVEYIEAYASSDDGFAFFGGTVNSKYLISAFNVDDAFDFDTGWRGNGQFWFGFSNDGNNMIECDGAKPDGMTPASNPTLSNITLMGNSDNSEFGYSLLLRDRTAGKFHNSIFAFSPDKGLSIEDLNPGESDSHLQLLNGEIVFSDNIWFQIGTQNDFTSIVNTFANGDNPDASDVINHLSNNNNTFSDPLFSSVCYDDLTCINPMLQIGSPALTGAQPLTDPFFDNVDYRGAFGNTDWMLSWSIFDETPLNGNCSNISTGLITVQKDENNNCLPDASDLGLGNWMIEIHTPDFNYFVETNANGEYTGFLPNNATEATLIAPNYLWSICTNTIPLTNLGTTGAVNAAFMANSSFDCPYMTVDISTPFLRRCFENKYHISYCNQGTSIAQNATVEVVLDTFLNFVSSAIPSTLNSDGVLVFDIGDVGIGECGIFSIDVLVSCDATLGQSHCSSAEIFPDSLCGSSSAGLPIISLDQDCNGNEIIFTITNTGNVPMGEESTYIITEDHVMLMTPNTNTFQLNAGESQEVTIPATGATYHIQTAKIAGSPEFGIISTGIEGCGTNGSGNFSVGFLNGFNISSGDPNTAIDCQENIGSYDPNDKTAYPTGIQAERYLRANTDVEYRIRFQNTGTDTAFNIVVVDTLSEYFDLATFRPGASSHDYEWNIEGRALSFKFANIMLPDSNINEVASHGFVKFKISQIPDLPDGTMLTNHADIYFDFNEPIRTNEEFYTIGQPLEVDVLSVSIQNINSEVENIQVYPNPFSQVTTFDLDDNFVKNGKLKLYNLTGQLIQTQNFSGNKFDFERRNLMKGIYFFEIQDENKNLASGKIIIQ